MKNKNKRKKNKGKKFNYLKYCIITIVAIFLVVGIYFFLTAEDDNTRLTILEKQWIMKNKKTLVDINVPNNLSVISDDGEGIVFDYLGKIEKDTGLKFNKKSYNYPAKTSGLSIKVLNNKNKILEDDILITEDNYILIGTTDNNITDLSNIYGKSIGVLDSDKSIVTNSVGSSYTYKTYSSVSEIVASLKNNTISYAIVPRYYALRDVVSNDIYVNYTFNNLTNKIVLRTTSNNRLSSIITKYLESFKASNYMSSYEKSFMDFYLETSGTSDLETTSLSSKVYRYGYVEGSSYNIKNNKKLYGFAGEYINLLSNMANIDLEYKEYPSNDRLDAAIKNDEVDIAFIDFDYKNTSGKYTINSFNPQMIALSKTNYPITDKTGLENRKLYTLKNTYLESYLKDNYNSILNPIKKVTYNVPFDGILVLDEIDYYYYANLEELSDYYSLLKDDYNASYRFFVQSDEDILYSFMNFILMYADSNDVKINSINNLIDSNNNKGGFENLYLIIVLIIIIPVILLFSLVAITKNKKSIKILRKETVLKYHDMLTSLKNRNYLNAHIEEWDDVKITPRSVIVADLNNLKYVNDNYGQEEGNMLIKKAAAILINTQLEKSEIIRTDGNEFLIYLIGYNKTQVNTYINKLSREFEKLPHGFGAAMGLSIIDDEIKTIDDAINEASINMRLDKEQNYK